MTGIVVCPPLYGAGSCSDGELVIFDDQLTPGPGIGGGGFVPFLGLAIADGLHNSQGSIEAEVDSETVLSCVVYLALDFNPVDAEGQPAPSGQLSYDCTLVGPADPEPEGRISVSFELILQ